MSDETVETQVVEPLEDNDALTGLSHEQALAELAKVRREAAGRRLKTKEIEAQLAELQKYKDAEKTELELAIERASKAEEVASKLTREKTAEKAAKDAGLDPALAEFLKGNTEEELLESAKALAARVGVKQDSAPDLFAGGRGGPVRAGNNSNAEAFRQLFTQS